MTIIMKSTFRMRVSYTACLCALPLMLFLTGDAFSKGGELGQQTVKPGDLSGIVSDSTGRKLAGKQVRIIDPNGKVVGSAVSDKYGIYRISGVPEGNYILEIDGETAVTLMVSKEATLSMLMFVLPTESAGLSPLHWTLIVIGGAVIVVGVPVVALASHGSSGGSSHVSP